MKRKRKNNRAGSMVAAAAMIGERIECVQMAKAAGCTAFRANGSIDCGALKSFLAEHPAIGEAVAKMPDAKLERGLKYQAERKLREAELGQLQGTLILKSEAKLVITRYGVGLKSKLLALPRQLGLPLSLTKDRTDAEQILLQAIGAILTQMFRCDWGECTCPHCGKEIGGE